MSVTPAPLYCSAACANALLVRSFGECPECNQTWDPHNPDESRHYRNNAWSICDTCSRQQQRCVRCGRKLPPPSE